MHTPLRKTFDNPQYLAKSRRYDNKCVCEICLCGKHKCPDPGVRFQGKTTNNQFYRPYQVQPQHREKKAEQPAQTRYDPQLLQSSYNKTFTPHKIQKEKPFIQTSRYEPPQTRFQGQSEYKTNYMPNKTKPERFYTSPSKEYVPNPAKFQDSTTYKREFSPKKTDSPSPFKRSKNTYQPSTTPFEGKTSYELSFKPHKIQPAKPQDNSKSRYTPSRTPFEGNTRYREFYQPYKIEPKELCPADYLPDRPPRCSPNKTHLHFSAEKNKWE